MKNQIWIIAIAMTFGAALPLSASEKAAPFTDSEAIFKSVLQKLIDKYAGQKISKDDLYRAATAGMLNSLNADSNDKEKAWNALLTPEDVREMQVDLSGKVTGIGAAMKFDEAHGYGQVVHVIAGSPAASAGLKTDDQILSVNGEKFKGKGLRDLVSSIRGEVGKKVAVRILRDDKIIDLSIQREVVPWNKVALREIDSTTALLYIDYFSKETMSLAEKYLTEVNTKRYKKLIVDVRGNAGGGFEEAATTTGFFLPANTVVARTKGRDQKLQEVKSTKGILNPDIQVVVLTDKNTHCGAELLTAALREKLHARVVGETTSGKWNVQSVEMLPNNYAIKYTVSEFFSPEGRSYQDKGLKPDIEVAFAKGANEAALSEIREKYDLDKMLAADAQLKAAVELVR